MNVVHTICQKKLQQSKIVFLSEFITYFLKMCNFHFIPDTLWSILFKKTRTTKHKFRKLLLYLKMRWIFLVKSEFDIPTLIFTGVWPWAIYLTSVSLNLKWGLCPLCWLQQGLNEPICIQDQQQDEGVAMVAHLSVSYH